ncbi:MAG: NAD(P)H-dependent oxidoreductase [Clostridia bacterium]|nr:NAD(P)H-dependent oxidoreductase [Clostridia bacterium]
MKILVVNGSPKGKYSITLQTVNYLQRKYKDHEFTLLNAGQSIKTIEKDFSRSAELLRSTDAVIFSYPVYTFIAPSQLHRFIELIFESGIDLRGKIATQITTSKHFYDVTAHKYIEENVSDLGMNYVRGLSADMDDLLTQKGRKEAEKFFDYFLWSCEHSLFESSVAPFTEHIPVAATCAPEKPKSDKYDVILVTDNTDENSNLANMIGRFISVFPYKVRVVNISEYKFSGGCLGCFNCAVSGKCIYKDGFDEFLRNSIQTADATVYAFGIRNHSMGSRFKMYDDRNFCNGHRTVTVGKPVGYIISGKYSSEHNLRMIIEGRSQVGSNFLSSVATDEANTDREIDTLSEKLSYSLESSHTEPQNFFGVGGRLIFRDLIYLMRGMMRADHKFYKKNGFYNDFPQKKWTMSLKMYLVGALLSSDKIRKKMGNKMNEGMLMPYNKLFEKMDKSK